MYKSFEQYLSVRDDSKATAVNKITYSYQQEIHLLTKELLRYWLKHISNAGFTNAKYTPHKLRHSTTLMYKQVM